MFSAAWPRPVLDLEVPPPRRGARSEKKPWRFEKRSFAPRFEKKAWPKSEKPFLQGSKKTRDESGRPEIFCRTPDGVKNQQNVFFELILVRVKAISLLKLVQARALARDLKPFETQTSSLAEYAIA